EGDAHVFHRVVGVDVQIALRFDLEVDHGVARDLVQHVVEEADAGGELGPAGAVEIELDANLGFQRVASHFRFAHFRVLWRLDDDLDQPLRLSCRAERKASFSGGVPTVTRRQFSSCGCDPCRFLIRTLRCFSLSKTPAASGTRNRMKFAKLGHGRTPGTRASARYSRSRSSRMAAA